MRLASMLRGASERGASEEPLAEATASPRHKQRWKSALAFAKTQTPDESGPAVFSHQGPDGSWTPYDASRCEEIAKAMKEQGIDGAVQLAGIPFEVRWGSRATSSRVATCVEIKFTARSCRPPRHRRDACSMAWRCRFLAAPPSQDGSVIAEK